jgi:three-Cys-motif partner protein
MPRIDHHDGPYDEGTRKKLEIYTDFLRAWLQVFLHTPSVPGPLRFFDFFAGPGGDKLNTLGSPLILMEELKRNHDLIARTGRQVRILFNEFKGPKYEALRAAVAERDYPFEPTIQSKEFHDAFEAHKAEIGLSPSIVFMDQCGVKFVTREIFQYLASLPTTDVVFFFASSSQRRFSTQFSNEIHVDKSTPHLEVHRKVAAYFRSWAPKEYFVGHYSILKGSNVYGLIFGSRHPRGMDKFLSANSGEEANYEIEADTLQEDFFRGHRLTRVEALAKDIEERIRKGEFRTDAEVVLHCLSEGILQSRVAPKVYVRLREQGVLCHTRGNQPRSSYDAIKEPRTLAFRVKNLER